MGQKSLQASHQKDIQVENEQMTKQLASYVIGKANVSRVWQGQMIVFESHRLNNEETLFNLGCLHNREQGLLLIAADQRPRLLFQQASTSLEQQKWEESVANLTLAFQALIKKSSTPYFHAHFFYQSEAREVFGETVIQIRAILHLSEIYLTPPAS